MKGHYAIIRHKLSGATFRIGTRVTKLVGRKDLRDWVKIRCDADYGFPVWDAPQYLCTQASSRPRLEQWYLDQHDEYELVKWVLL